VKRILVGVDGSEGAAIAMKWAAGLASRIGAQVIVMTGFVPTDSELQPRRVEALHAEQEVQVEAWSEVVRSEGVAVQTVVEWGDPRPGILIVAERERADLIVVGRVGRSAGPGLFHIGSMAEWLAHHSDLPIAVIGGAAEPTTRCVLVGVDGSEGSGSAVGWVRDTLADSELRVVAAAAHEPLLEWTPAMSETNWRRELERQIREDFVAELIAADVAVEARVLSGANTAALLLQAAQDERADLIVLGARGLGGFTGLRVGGVALRVLHEADRPIVLVPSTHGS
jgi:nucleotide-binding universal stress UspA family protein